MAALLFVRNALWGGVWGENIEEFLDNGGPRCAESSSFMARLFEQILFVPFYTWLFIKLWRRKTPVSASKSASKKCCEPGWLDYLFFVMLAAVYGMQLRYKFTSGRMMFLLNPCHVITVVQMYLVLSNENHASRRVFKIMLYNLFCTWTAMIFPVTDSLDLFYEAEMYWIQHALIAIVPLYLLLSGRYWSDELRDWSHFWLGHSFFGIWMFGVLATFSQLTWVNLNCTLCPSKQDIVAVHLSKELYRILAAAYLGFLGFVFGIAYIYVSLAVRKVAGALQSILDRVLGGKAKLT
eukprot:GILK01002623.1.p1 GENE.GILK01002623.1~~GILK01002623.1.p1  ORF type:complete len:316 (+),score=13.72 GILK01002623.1:69-950(+)